MVKQDMIMVMALLTVVSMGIVRMSIHMVATMVIIQIMVMILVLRQAHPVVVLAAKVVGQVVEDQQVAEPQRQ